MHMKLWTGLYLHVILLGCTAAVVRCTWSYRLSNNNNNNHDNVYGAVIVTKVIATVHPVHLMNVDWAPGGRQPSDQANWLGLWVHVWVMSVSVSQKILMWVELQNYYEVHEGTVGSQN